MLENENTSIVFASLVLRGKDLIPQEVIDAIGIIPTKSFKRGDLRTGNKKWPHGYWELESKGFVQSLDLEMHLEWLITQLEPSKNELIGLLSQEGIDAELTCFWILPTNHESLSLSSTLLRKLASLGIKLNIDIYSPD